MNFSIPITLDNPTPLSYNNHEVMMMLDEKDLLAIGNLIDVKLDAKLDAKLAPIHEEIRKNREEICKNREEISKNREEISKNREEISKNSNEIRKINVTLENIVFPQLQALAEGQKTILETLSPKNRVEALEDEVVFLKQVIKSISRDVSELKKAQ